MNKKAAIVLLAAVSISLAAPIAAHRYRSATNDHPLRLVGYALHPVGLVLEFAVMRPVHWVVSRPHLDVAFGHQAHMKEDGTYFEWKHGDYEPSIAVERAAKAQRQNPKKDMEMKADKKEAVKKENGRTRPGTAK